MSFGRVAGLAMVMVGCGSPRAPLDSTDRQQARPAEPLAAAAPEPLLEQLEHLAYAPRAALHVCAACPFADDANPGTESLPLRSISAALAQGGGVVIRVASAYSLEPTFEYREDLQLPAGAVLEGRLLVTGPAGELSWGPGLEPTALFGTVTASSGSARLGGFAVHGRITLAQTDAALSDVEVVDAVGLGLDVIGGAVTLEQVHVGAGPSVGISISGARAVLRDVTVDQVPVAVRLDRPLSLQWSGGSAKAYLGNDCVGIRWLGGAAEPSVIEDVEASGCLPVPGATSPLVNRGIEIDACALGSADLVLRRVRATGGWLGGGYAAAPGTIGIAVRGECPVTIEHSDVLGAVDSTSEPGWSGIRSAAGIVCENAPCLIRSNRSIVGASSTAPADVARGIHCNHGCLELDGNRGITAGAGLDQVGVLLHATSPRVVRNAITSAGTAPTCVKGAALETRLSESLIADNFIVAPDCHSGGVGVALGYGRPTLVLNTVLGREAAVRCETQAALVDNLLQVEAGGVVLESIGPAPAALQHNDLFVVGGGGVLYRRLGVDFTLAAQIGAGTLSVDPQLTADPPHLSPGSPLRSAGCATGLVVDLDFDGQPRPDAQPDVGADQLP